MLDQLTTFDFEEHAVRVVMRDGEPWFVAADVCRVLEIANRHDALGRLDEDERDAVGNTDSIGREQQMSIVSESGLYALIFTSRKPEAKQFRKWVTSVVLPSIRKHGFYMHAAPEAPADDLAETPLREASHWLSMVREARLLQGRGAALRLWAKSPLPDMGQEPVDLAQETSAIPAFLAACCAVTGDPRDRVRTVDLWRAFRQWADDEGIEPLSERAFYKRLSAMAGHWRCPKTGQRIGRIKASAPFVSGIILEVGA